MKVSSAQFRGQASWLVPQEPPQLGAHEIHVWRARLDASSTTVETLAQQLAPDELARSARFAFQRDRDRYIGGRGLLRNLLGSYLGLNPSEVALAYGPHGKPSLSGSHAHGGLAFNVSHSCGFALFAFSREMEIGVDVERFDPDVDVEEIAGNFFSEKEVSMLRSRAASRRHELFFQFWTRKEALVKARGEGLSIPLCDFDISHIPSQPYVSWHLCRALGEDWWMCGLAPAQSYAAALVCAHEPLSLGAFTWPERGQTRT